MTLAQIMAIYTAALPVGEVEAIESVFLTGYYLGKGTNPPANAIGIVATLTAPTAAQTVTLTRPDLR